MKISRKSLDSISSLGWSKVDALSILIRDNFKCSICGTNLKEVTQERLRFITYKPKMKFPKISDYILVCRKCNSNTVKLNNYYTQSSEQFFAKLLYDHVSRKLPVRKAEAILKGRIKSPSPWNIKKKREIGVRKPESTTSGNQNINRRTRLAIYIRDNYTCQYCQKNLIGLDPREITLNCFIPVIDGGRRIPTNLVMCCSLCSKQKRQSDWRVRLERAKKLKAIEINLNKDINYYRKIAKAVLNGENNKFWNPWEKKNA